MKSKTLSRVCKMLKPKKKAIIIISILAIIINIGEVIKPYLIKTVIDDYLSAGVWQRGAFTIGVIGALYIGIVVFRKYNRFYNKYINNYDRRRYYIQNKK